MADAIVADSLGEMSVSVSSLRQRFLEDFRLRSEHAASISPDMREALAARLVEDYGSPGAAIQAVWSLARENEWSREAVLPPFIVSLLPEGWLESVLSKIFQLSRVPDTTK